MENVPFSSPSAGIRGRRANPSSFLLQCSPYHGEIPHPQLSPTHQRAHYTPTPHVPPQASEALRLSPAAVPEKAGPAAAVPGALPGREPPRAGDRARLAARRGPPRVAGQAAPAKADLQGVAVRPGHRGGRGDESRRQRATECSSPGAGTASSSDRSG